MVDKAKVKIYWEKSVENRQVSDTAFVNNQFNASASRYYYALYHGLWAFLENKGITIPADLSRGGNLIKNRHPDTWPKPELLIEAAKQLSTEVPNLEPLMRSAERARVKGDYEPFPVEERDLKNLRKNADIIFDELDKLL